MRILVTGATGRIGANLVKALLEKGHRIRGFVYPGDASRAHKLDKYPQVEIMAGDLRNYDDVKTALEGMEVIYHLAAAFGGPFDNRDYLAINGGGALNLLEVARTLPNFHRFIYASTEAVYWELTQKGRLFEKPITEDMVAKYHHMPYFLTKWIGEELCMTYHYQYQVPVTVFRFSTVIEPSEFLNESGLPARFLLSPVVKGSEKLVIKLNPDGRPYKEQLCDVRDIASGLVLGMEKDQAVGEVFNLAGAVMFEWGETVRYLSKRFNIGYIEEKQPQAHFFEIDITKIRKLLGYEPIHDLKSVVDTALAIRRGEDVGVISTGVRYGPAA